MVAALLMTDRPPAARTTLASMHSQKVAVASISRVV